LIIKWTALMCAFRVLAVPNATFHVTFSVHITIHANET